MANQGGGGNRFATVNLNKSYGSHFSHNNNNGPGNGNGPGMGRGRPGMVVLSRARSIVNKTVSKLSVPPPLNLPSLRKEHQKFDSLGGSGSGSGSGASGSAGVGARPSSSGLGWSKPSAAVVVTEKDDVVVGDRMVSSNDVRNVDAGTSAYLPPSVRGGTEGTVSRASVLRGEDFPSLRATLNAAANGQTQWQKEKESAHNRCRFADKQIVRLQETPDEIPEGGTPHTVSLLLHDKLVDTGKPGDRVEVTGIYGAMSGGNSRSQEQGRKQDDYFPGPLPLVRLNPRSDWADDERDTSHGLSDRGRDVGYSRTEAYWDRDFDFPKTSFPPHKPVQNSFDRRGQRDNDVGKGLSNEVFNADSLGRDVRAASREGREGNTWRAPVAKDVFGSQDVVSVRSSLGVRGTVVNRETTNENKYTPPQWGGSTRDEHNNAGFGANREIISGRRDQGYGQSGRQQWNNSADSNNIRGAERNFRDHYGSDSNRYKADGVQNNMGSRFSGVNKMSSSDRLPSFTRDKRSFTRSEKPYVEDPFAGIGGFDEQDPFSSGVLGVIKRKKDTNKQLDFYDPVRQSFEAELERVQKMQEQERQRVVEEQERAMEMAHREEEEKLRVVREQQEQQRRLEEEAREAAWRAEQDRLEAAQRAEELRLAREEEKQRLQMEEGRRKQAAKQKLLELEERMARRQTARRRTESTKADSPAAISGDNVSCVDKDRDISRTDDFVSWEDGERMVERITNSASSDSSLSRTFDIGSRDLPVRDGSLAFTDRGKPFNACRRDVFENGNNSSFFSADHENVHQSHRPIGGRSFPRKDMYGGQGYMPTRAQYRGAVPDSHVDDIPHARGNRWNVSGDGNPFGRNMDFEAEYHKNFADKFDVSWGQGQGRGRGYSPFPERLYQDSDIDEFYTYGRSRYPARQPRVLPPPSLPPAHRTSFRTGSDHPGPSAFDDGNIHFSHGLPGESTAGSYQGVREENSDLVDVPQQSVNIGGQGLNRRTTPGCDSQSSLSVSSPPSSPTQLSHDEFDESRESLAVLGAVEGQDISVENEAVLLNAEAGGNTVTTASSVSVGDDEEWTVENNEESQEQEEYDEDVGYHEEDEVHEGDDDIAELTNEFEEMHLEGEGSQDMIDNLVLGFDQGVEVGIPNDDYEKSPGPEESLYVGPTGTVGDVELKESFESIRDEQSPQVPESLQHVTTDTSCATIEDTEKALQKPINTSVHKPTMDAGDSSRSVSHSQLLASSPLETNSLPSSHTAPGAATSQGPAELPVKLQFGLFSGPSLIPSPVPAIQIGSIQMPLQLHPQIGPPLPHMHSSQSPLFQFGQLSYPPPMSQGILHSVPQSVSFVQPNVTHSHTSSQVPGGPLSAKPVQDSSSRSSVKNDVSSLSVNSHQIHPPSQSSVSQEPGTRDSSLLAAPIPRTKVLSCQKQADASITAADPAPTGLVRQADHIELPHSLMRNSRHMVNSRPSEIRSQGRSSSSHSAPNQKYSSGPAAHPFPGNKGRRSAFSARNPGARMSSPVNEVIRSDINGIQRRPRRVAQRFEFRVRQTADGKQSSTAMSSNCSGLDTQSNYDAQGSGTVPKSGLSLQSDKAKQTVDLSSEKILDQGSVYGINEDKQDHKFGDNSQRVEGSLKRNINSEDDVDAPLQSGIVRVYKQTGIEAPSDEDDFIEVRSKRQMLNDRREQREKEIKAKTRNNKKPQRKSRPAPQVSSSARSFSRSSTPSSTQAAKSTCAAVSSKQGSLNNEVSAPVNKIASQPLAPIGTPPVIADSQADAKAQTMKLPQKSPYSTGGLTSVPDVSDLTSDAQSKVDRAQSSLGCWGSSSDQPVMALTQTQLEDAMKPACFDRHMISIGDQTSSVSEPSMSSSSVRSKDSPFPSATSPISSLLAGEKIQFGAVTSQTIIPPSSRVVSQVMRPASTSLDLQMSQRIPASENNCSILFEKGKPSDESCRPLEDCEAEAEAAASAVAVAAIGNDEIVGTGADSCSAATSDPIGFGAAAIDGTSGMSGDQHTVIQSKAEETLSVSLPADLSVETPPISVWPPLPSPHGSSQMLSPFPVGPASHFPFYDMNPMMGGPVFAFGPNEDSAQSQLQKNATPSSGPLGTWQQCHTSVDSFYGPSAGFTAPFISPPGGIPGVQGPPHMVVYNHFAPVGPFGQVGLSYMGTTYIPSGKQPDWKHNPTSSAMGGGPGGEGEMNNLNMIPVQRNTLNVPTQVQHLAPGSPLLSMASPLAMFEVSPFQSSHDLSVNPRWPHVQASSAHTIPQSMPLQQQVEIAVPSPFSHGSSNHQSVAANGVSKPQTSSSLEDGRSFTVDTNAAATLFPDELGLADPLAPTGPESPAVNIGSRSHIGDSVRDDSAAEGSGNRRNLHAAVSTSQKPQVAQHKNASGQQHYNHHQRGGQKNGSGAEWSNRKTGFHGRNHSSGGDRSFPPGKVKQIYVAKQSTGKPSTAT